VVVGLHNTVNMRYPVDIAELDGSRETGGYFERPYGASAPFRALATPRSQTSDLIASMIGHGMLSRFPRLKVVIVEHFNEWTRPMLSHFADAYERTPTLFDEDPLEVLRRNIWIHIFRDPNPVELIGLLGVANSMFGSDFPHPEGLRDPLAFSDDIASLPLEDQKAVMGGNLARLMEVV
jgi:predicted TIM-barrel fold metal-dependent hydrolase